MASATRIASATISGVTSNGSLWIVSPGAVARRAIGSSRSRVSPSSPMPARVIGRSHLGGEPQHLLDGRARRPFEHQLHQQSEGDLLAVEIGVGLGRGGQAVVHGVRGGQARGLEAQAREQGIGLDQSLQGRGD